MVLVLLASIAAGALGSLVGLGGGLILVPILTLLMGVNIHFAVGASLISVLANSSGGAAAYVKDRITNLRIGIFLELATTTGAVVGAATAAYLNTPTIEAFFGAILLLSLVPLIKKIGEEVSPKQELKGFAQKLSLKGSYTERDDTVLHYNAANSKAALPGMFVAGLISGVLGIGSGTFKVLSMDLGMRLPMKVSTTTANFMMGVTAASSAGIYFVRGDINPLISAPVALGVLFGALIGTRLLVRSRNSSIRKVFVIVLAASAAEMIAKAAGL